MAGISRLTEALFDTTALVDIYRGREEIRPYFDALVNGDFHPFISVITEAELWRGVKLEEIELHETLLSHFASIPLHSETARLAGAWMQRHAAGGLGWMDAFITATARLANLPLLTRNHHLVQVLQAEARFELYG